LSGSSLFLDFDGTLVELASAPDEVRLPEEVKSLLGTLQAKLSGRLALLSGRSLADLRSYLRPLAVAAGGSHGLEVSHSPELEVIIEPPPGLAEAVARLEPLHEAAPGVLIERKPAGVAVHYRQVPSAEGLCRATAEEIASETGLDLQLGKMVIELKPKSTNKGKALRSFMSHPPFAGSTPIFIGDDLTDEDGFEAARELGGAGILVGDERSTKALYRLESVGAVVGWLAAASKRIG
jgi:trehalose 6-phosphate phosphatase